LFVPAFQYWLYFVQSVEKKTCSLKGGKLLLKKRKIQEEKEFGWFFGKESDIKKHYG